MGDGCTILTVDISNAFNFIDRQVILDEIERVSPHLLPWVEQGLGHPASLIYGDHIMKVREGSPKGTQ